MSGGRHTIQRSNRVRLKADCHAMLEKLGKDGLTLGEIAEMMVRLKPPTGAAAPIVLTGYTQMDKAGKVRVVPLNPLTDWAVEAVIRRPVDGMDERFGEPLDSIRYRKD